MEVHLAAAGPGLVERTVANTRAGTVKACRRARLAPSVGGQIATLEIREGQRVAIARATVTEPDLILADEPTGNLDHHSRHEVIRTLEQLNGRGLALIVVTHDPEIRARARRRIRMVDEAVAEDNTGGV